MRGKQGFAVAAPDCGTTLVLDQTAPDLRGISTTCMTAPWAHRTRPLRLNKVVHKPLHQQDTTNQCTSPAALLVFGQQCMSDRPAWSTHEVHTTQCASPPLTFAPPITLDLHQWLLMLVGSDLQGQQHLVGTYKGPRPRAPTQAHPNQKALTWI